MSTFCKFKYKKDAKIMPVNKRGSKMFKILQSIEVHRCYSVEFRTNVQYTRYTHKNSIAKWQQRRTTVYIEVNKAISSCKRLNTAK